MWTDKETDMMKLVVNLMVSVFLRSIDHTKSVCLSGAHVTWLVYLPGVTSLNFE